MRQKAHERPLWNAVVLAAARGGDPLSKAFGVSHKCLLPVAGEPMLKRVVTTLSRHPAIGRIVIVIDDEAAARCALGATMRRVEVMPARDSAALSTAAALDAARFTGPVLVTTGDHALLDAAMLDHFIARSEALAADVTAAVALAETILERYPHAKRTFLSFGRDRVSGCNLYGLLTPQARQAVAFWQHIEANRKKPLKMAAAFGIVPLLRFLTGTIDLDGAFRLASARIGIIARPVVMPFAEAAIDVDKPEDKALAEEILARR
jgi:GTP:adenosylcobinamide-phosphate guanylyltransferase